MKYAITSFALIITLVCGFIFGAYYMYNKYNPKPIVETVESETAEEEELDNSAYYDSDGNWIFRYGTDENINGETGSNAVSAGGTAAENIDYRITGTNFVYEDDGTYSGFHAVVTVENIGSGNLYLGSNSVFDIEDRTLNVVDSYDYVRAVPDVIAPGEKGFFYVPYGQIKTREDSVTIEEGDLSGEVLDVESGDTIEGAIDNGEDVNAVDIDELEKALGIRDVDNGDIEESSENSGPGTSITEDDGSSDSSSESSGTKLDDARLESGKTNTIASIKAGASESGVSSVDVRPQIFLAAADASKDADAAESSSENGDNKAAEKSDSSSDTEKSDNKSDASESATDANTTDANAADSDTSASDESALEDAEPGTVLEGITSEAADEAEEDAAPEKPQYPGLSLYKVNEYFIMPRLDIQKCADDPKVDHDIDRIVYGSNNKGYFTLSANVTNETEKNIDFIPVTVIALDRRGNAIAACRDSITDFYSGATKSFGVSYVLTREQRSNIVQCIIYARDTVVK
ncbi:FxLYD domain-containing protein [Butyrivibrio sp. WCD3002]|uniref:FxLYD domain-containing protein n=1 Tax=Butyrivibrio sp. WCD3002 TaxID=1280676 RepID=UPI0003F60F2B|nr:FxLYD domain-containing protein [Butyrivibrio sp. WCD3002]